MPDTATSRRRILDLLAAGTISGDEAEHLLDALGENDIPPSATTDHPVAPRPRARYLHIVVSNRADQREHVKIRIPLSLISSGMKLARLLPEDTRQQIDTALHDNGLSISLADITADDIDDLISTLDELEINVNDNTQVVRIYCS